MKKLLKILILPFCIAIYFIGDYLYEPFRLPDYLDKILHNANLGGSDSTIDRIVRELKQQHPGFHSDFDSTKAPMDAIVDELNDWSTYEETKPDPREGFEDEDRQIITATNYSFGREKDRLIIYHSRMNNWVAEKIIENFRKDLEFLFWRLGPKRRQDEAKLRGENTPSWGDSLEDFRKAGFVAIILANDKNTWNFPIR